MKRQIRQGVFETNSSSTHAICISKDHDTSKLKLPIPCHLTMVNLVGNVGN